MLPPYEGADVALCLGSPISLAGGAARTGQPAIAVIGDYGLLHSGLEALLDVARWDLPVLVVVLANGVSAQTGGQTSPAGPRQRPGLRSIRLVPLLDGVGVPVGGAKP